MENKNNKMLNKEEQKMKAMYGEPCHLLKGMLVALLIEATAVAVLIGIGRVLASLFFLL